ncbi:MAG: putative drug resistance transporter [Ilumatobacteraceae bacterium]|nr:putative drug resistance transporter [Ilumatobacteraceae bacterium]
MIDDQTGHDTAGDIEPTTEPQIEIEQGEFAAIAITEPKERNPWVVLTSTSLAVFAVFLDTTIGFVSFPAISATFRASGPSTLSWVLNAYTLVFAALLIPSGRLADRVGRRKMFLIGVVTFTTASMLCGLAPNVGFLIGAEMLEAVGAAILVPASLALVLQTFPREKIPVAVAIWGAIGAVAGAAGPTLGALVVSNLSWRWAFYINLPVGLFSFTLGKRVLPEGREANPGRLPDPLGVLSLAGGIGLVTYAIVETNTWGWASGRFVGTLAAAVLVLGFFVYRCSSVSNPVIHLALFRANNFRWANMAMIVLAIGFNAMFLGNVLFLTRVWQYSILRAGLAISVGPLIVAATAPQFGKLAGRIGQRRLLMPGGLLWAAGGIYLIIRATTSPDYLGVYLPAVVCTGIGVALCLPQLSSAAVQGLPPDQFGSGSAVGQAVRNLGSTFGVALVVAFTTGLTAVNALDGFHHVWWLLAGCGSLVTLLSSRLVRIQTPAAPEIAAASAH